MRAGPIVQRGLRTPTGPFFARFFIGIILGLVAEFAFIVPSTRMVLSSSAARWKRRKQIGRLKCRPGCSTGRHALGFCSSTVCQHRGTCGAVRAARSGVEGSNAISRPAFWRIRRRVRLLPHGGETSVAWQRRCFGDVNASTYPVIGTPVEASRYRPLRLLCRAHK